MAICCHRCSSGFYIKGAHPLAHGPDAAHSIILSGLWGSRLVWKHGGTVPLLPSLWTDGEPPGAQSWHMRQKLGGVRLQSLSGLQTGSTPLIWSTGPKRLSTTALDCTGIQDPRNKNGKVHT